MAGLVSRLVNVVLGIRLNNCHTRFAHSYHIWTYLNGFGELRQYKGLLNTAQALWLYRNIRYITNNAGKSSTFDKLVENLLTKRNIQSQLSMLSMIPVRCLTSFILPLS